MDEIIEMFKELQKMHIEKLKQVKKSIKEIKINNITNEKVIERVFDQLLDLTYFYKEDIKDIYYDYLKYYEKINIEAAKDYEKFYLEIIEEDKIK